MSKLITKKIAIITAGLLLVGCTASYLGQRISLNLVEIKAKQEGVYCYKKDNGDAFCVIYAGGPQDD